MTSSRTPRRRLLAATTTALLLLTGLVPGASATHLSTVSLDPPATTTTTPGGTGTLAGNVDGSGDGGCEYGWTLGATGGPAGTTFAFTPSSEPSGAGVGAVVTLFTLSIGVPAGAAPGTYPITVTVDWDAPTGCLDFGDESVIGQLVVEPTPCQADGGWALQFVGSGDQYDKNGDGYICTKVIPGNGQGNSANSQRGTGQSGFHADGHNHKDNKG